MKKYIFIFSFLFLFGFSFSNQEYIDKNLNGHNSKVIKVTLDGNHFIVSSISATGESLSSLINKVGGVSGINGSYFAPVDYGNSKNIATNERIYNGNKYFPNIQGDFGARGLFGFDKSGNPKLILNNFGYVNGINRKLNLDNLNSILYGISNYPVLLINGKNVVEESDFPEIIGNKLKNPGNKSFICSKGNTIYMGFISDIDIYSLPDYLIKSFGCQNAINLDAGGSLGMIYNSKQIKKEGRNIMDAFVVVDKNKYYQLLQKNGIILSNFSSSEIESSYNFFFENKLTKLDIKSTDLNIGSYRREIAILLNRFINFIGLNLSSNNICNFKDLIGIDFETKNNIQLSCKNGLFKGNTLGEFLPNDIITKGDFLVVVSRLIKGDSTLEVESSYRYLLNEGIISYSQYDLTKELTRSDIYVILHNIYNKYYKR